MKRTLLSTLLALTALFSTGSQAAIVSYTESGSDLQGDSFSLIFQWDNVNDYVVNASAGSFTDSSGTFTNITTYDIELPIAPGVIGVQFSDPTTTDLLVLALNQTTIPTPDNTAFGYYVETASQMANVGYSSGVSLSASNSSVPEPSSLATISAGLMAAVAARRKNVKFKL